MDGRLAERKFVKLHEIIAKHGFKVSNLVSILQEVQDEYRFLPEEVMTYIATCLGIPPAVVFGVATFYTQFSMSPKGKYVIKVCDGTACHVRGSDNVWFAIREAAGLREGETTTSDLKFTVEKVACLGMCGLSPAVMVNDQEVYAQMTAEQGRRLIERLLEEAETERVAEAGPAPVEEVRLPAFTIKTRQDLDRYRDVFQGLIKGQRRRILVCAETACVASGSLRVYEELRRLVEEKGLLAEVVLTREGEPKRPLPADGIGVVKAGCHGLCQAGPLVKIEPGNIIYTKVTPEDARDIIDAMEKEELVHRLLYKDEETGRICYGEADNPFYKGQRKVVLGTCGLIDSESLEEYIGFGGYQALAKALFEMSPDQVIGEVADSGLRGRGGAGFPTGTKWRFARQAPGDEKYVVCNGDEGDPGAFMDRCVLEGDPHRVLEGMMIAGYAVGAREGYIYVRAEYPLAVKRVKTAIAQLEACGLLGDNILGSDFSFRVIVREGAGAFVCGEETALLASIEGKRGMPRPRPPFPAQSGLFGKPTVINNVETYANVPAIILNGADSYRQVGTEKSKGTKTFSLAGQIRRTGLIEVPFGSTLRDIVFNIGGGIRGGKQFKAVQIGGPSGGCLTSEHLDIPLDYDSLQAVGAIVGSGGLVVMDEGTCMVEVAKFFMTFIQNESCGKCIPCREGTKRMLDILTRITEGRGSMEDIDLLFEIAMTVKNASLCGLGRTAPNPVLTTLRYFRNEYEAHVLDKKCPAGVCKALRPYYVIEEKCNGCGACRRVCPSGAITGEKKKPHFIDPSLCTRCGTCFDRCKFDAIAQ